MQHLIDLVGWPLSVPRFLVGVVALATFTFLNAKAFLTGSMDVGRLNGTVSLRGEPARFRLLLGLRVSSTLLLAAILVLGHPR